MDEARVAKLLDAIPALTRGQARVLMVLLDRRCRIVPQTAMCEAVFDLSSDFPSLDSVRTSIKLIRRKVAHLPLVISTIYGIGWRLDMTGGWWWE